MLDATPDHPGYEGYSATLQPFGGEGEEPERALPFGFARLPTPAPADWWDDCGVVD